MHFVVPALSVISFYIHVYLIFYSSYELLLTAIDNSESLELRGGMHDIAPMNPAVTDAQMV